jgi:hypothetical protein
MRSRTADTITREHEIAELDLIEEAAKKILTGNPDTVVRFRLLRDVLRRPPDSAEVTRAKTNLSKSRWVQELQKEQWDDGSWGRFHTEDTSVKQKIATTEVGRSIDPLL